MGCAPVKKALAISALKVDDVWIGGDSEEFGHFDGNTLQIVGAPKSNGESIVEILSIDNDLWMVTSGLTRGAGEWTWRTGIMRWSGGKSQQWNVNHGLDKTWKPVGVSGIDSSHVWRSGTPAAAWDGTDWKPLDFDADAVWARAVDEIYFANGGDISRWNGKTLERVFHGLIPITKLSGSPERALAVGPGGLTIEFARWPESPSPPPN